MPNSAPFMIVPLQQLTPMCPPRRRGEPGIPVGEPGCPDRFAEAGGWFAVGAAVVVAIGVVVLLVRAASRGDATSRRFAVNRWLAAAGMALVIGAVLSMTRREGVVASLPIASLLTAAASIVAGVALGPAGSRVRGVFLGAGVYVMGGIAALPFAAATVGVGLLDAAGLLFLQLPFWPDVLAAALDGTYRIG